MKVVKSKSELLLQPEGLKGMFKHLEKVGRVAYRSEDKITEDSYEKFINMLKNRGHWAVFDSGTVYLSIPIEYSTKDLIGELKSTKPFTRWVDRNGYSYITTNYRIVLKLGLEDKDIWKYWCDPTEYHHRRVTFIWTCSRGTAFEVVRHRAMSFVMESTRYCNYSKDKFGNELTFILPQWAYRLRDYLTETIDPLTKEYRSFLKSLDGEELWKALCCIDRTAASHNDSWKKEELDYIYETTTDEGFKLKAEEARGILGNDLKCSICITGYIEDFMYEPKDGDLEKAGFFYLRTARDAHPDIIVLATQAKNDLLEYENNKRKG